MITRHSGGDASGRYLTTRHRKNGHAVPGTTNYPLLFDRTRRPRPASDAVLAVPRP